MAEKPAPVPDTPPDALAKKPVKAEPVTRPQTAPGQLTLERVERDWDQVLHVVRERNPMTQGLLNTGCEPVEVNSSEIVITFPHPFLRERLRDPQRRMEIQEALDEVLGTTCGVKLVLASEYAPDQPASSAPPTPEPDEVPTLDKKDLDQISRWADEHGGATTVME